MGAPKWPPNPQRSERPGEAVALLDHGLLHRRERRRPPDLVYDALDERPVRLARLARGQPLRIGRERLPDALAMREVVVRADVDHLVRLADHRLPEAHDVDAVL